MRAQVEVLTLDATQLADAAAELAEVVARFDLETARQAAGQTSTARKTSQVPVKAAAPGRKTRAA